MNYTKNILPADSVKMYQTHGDHIAAVMDTETFIKDYLQETLSQSKLVGKSCTEVNLEAEESYLTDVFSLLHGEENLGFMALIATDKAKSSNQFVSTYPVFFGKTLRVRICTVWVWSNLIEATVECCIQDFTFSFFATDYFMHKDEYIPGNEIDLQIGAWGLRVEEAEHGFAFEGQQAVDRLAKIGGKPQFDDEGRVMPVKFNTENMVAFFTNDERCPDEPEFQSPAGEMKEKQLLCVELIETEIFIHRDSFEVSIPLIYKKSMCPIAKAGMPLRGFMWIVGKIA